MMHSVRSVLACLFSMLAIILESGMATRKDVHMGQHATDSATRSTCNLLPPVGCHCDSVTSKSQSSGMQMCPFVQLQLHTLHA